MVRTGGCFASLAVWLLLFALMGIRIHEPVGDESVIAWFESRPDLFGQVTLESRRDATQYALAHYGGGARRNDAEYPFFGIVGNRNCANFASQVLFAGGLQPNVAAGWWMGENQGGRRLSGCGGERRVPWWAWLGGLGGYLAVKYLPDPILGPRGDCGLVWSSAPHLYHYLTTTEGLSRGVTALWVDLTKSQLVVLDGDPDLTLPGDLAFFFKHCPPPDWQTCQPYHVAVVVGHVPRVNAEGEIDTNGASTLWLVDDTGRRTTVRLIDAIAAEFSRLIVIVHIQYPQE